MSSKNANVAFYQLDARPSPAIGPLTWRIWIVAVLQSQQRLQFLVSKLLIMVSDNAQQRQSKLRSPKRERTLFSEQPAKRNALIGKQFNWNGPHVNGFM